MSLPELIVAGNWKMNGVRADLAEIAAVREGTPASSKVGIWIFPPATLITAAAALRGGADVLIGAQDCHAKDSGAFTGDLSAALLKDAGAAAIIVGHSERRGGHGETSHEIRAKASAVLKAGLPVIICLGETKGEREAGRAPAVCTRQLTDSLPAESTPENTVIAYEPVWAIGTGLQATVDDITAIHAVLRAELGKREGTGTQAWRILYGGSVSPANAAGIFESREVDGVLVGGASLKAASFLAIISAGAQALERRKS